MTLTAMSSDDSLSGIAKSSTSDDVSSVARLKEGLKVKTCPKATREEATQVLRSKFCTDKSAVGENLRQL
jgi:hypothetical protein